MREILFRGKRLCLDEWVEGYFVRAKMYRSDEELCEYISIPHPETEGMPSDMFLVDPDTVGQFTGQTDKNGKKIFEGDIVDILHEGVYQCCWDEANFEFCFRNYRESFGIAYAPHNLHVIGNIHDNPELMEGREGE